MSATVARPSDGRRKALKDADNLGQEKKGVPMVSNFFPIDRYYEAAEKVCSDSEFVCLFRWVGHGKIRRRDCDAVFFLQRSYSILLNFDSRLKSI